MPLIPANNASMVKSSLKFSQTLLFLSIISLLDEPFSLNVGAMDFLSLSHIKKWYRYTLSFIFPIKSTIFNVFARMLKKCVIYDEEVT